MPSIQTPHPVRTAAVLSGFLLCVFAIGTAELLVAGLLPPIAVDLGVSVPVAGQAVTSYALGVVIGGPLITIATARVPRRGLTLALVSTFVVGCIGCSAATSYGLLLAARLCSALAHSTLFAASLVVVTAMVPAERAGRAVSAIVSGLSFATLVGVPAGSLLGQHLGWRAPFLAVAAIAAVGGVLLALSLPSAPRPTEGPLPQALALTRRPVYLAIATTSVGYAGVFAVLTYIVPLLTTVSGFTETAASGLLLAYGVGSVAGNLVAGRLAEKNLTSTLLGAFLGLAAVLAALPFAAPLPSASVVVIIAFGVLATATIAPLQLLILRHAGAASTLAVAVNVSAFNLANALGALLGGAMVALSGPRWLGLAGAALALLGLVLSRLAVRYREPCAAPEDVRSCPS